MTREEKWSLVAVILLFLGAGTFVVLSIAADALGTFDSKIEDPDASEAAAEKIILLLNHYKNATGDYPRTLEELEEYFWVTIEDVPSGYRNWDYRYVEKNNFVLRFGENDSYYPCHYYESSTGEWSVDQ